MNFYKIFIMWYQKKKKKTLTKKNLQNNNTNHSDYNDCGLASRRNRYRTMSETFESLWFLLFFFFYAYSYFSFENDFVLFRKISMRNIVVERLRRI